MDIIENNFSNNSPFSRERLYWGSAYQWYGDTKTDKQIFLWQDTGRKDFSLQSHFIFNLYQYIQ
jgi:hypothetical protein